MNEYNCREMVCKDTVLYLYCKTVSRCFFSFFFIVIINCFIILLPLWRIKFHIKNASNEVGSKQTILAVVVITPCSVVSLLF